MGLSRSAFALVALVLSLLAGPARAEGSEKRIALVIGNAAYAGAPLATVANDAGLVAQTLQAAGFDVVGARDLDEAAMRQAMRDFLDKAAASGPDTVAFVYLAGYGLQLEGENYFAPVDARIAVASDVPLAAMRVSDYAKRLAALPLKARFLVLDAGRRNPFARTGEPLAGGLALAEAEPGSLVAFNAAPGTVGADEAGPYGAYARALAEMIREGGLPPAELFDRVRLRVSEATKGGLVPWDSVRIEAPFVFFQRAADAPAQARPAEIAALRARPIREIGARDAFALCVESDSLQGYQDFLAAYPGDPLAGRVRAILAARREAVIWRRTWLANTPEAYWTYLTRYPRGPHAWDARRRLTHLAAALQPPPRFTAFAYDVPPPPPEEIVYVERPALYFDDPAYGFIAPPPPPAVFLAPPAAFVVDLAPPPPPLAAYLLPTPAFVPVPAYVSAPAYVEAPPGNVLYQHIHNTTMINTFNAQNAAPRGMPAAAAIGAGAVIGAAAGIAAMRVALPPSVARQAGVPPAPALVPGRPIPGPGGGRFEAPAAMPANPAGLIGAQPGRPGRAATPAPNALPGQGGKPLPVLGTQPAPPVPVAGRPAGQPLPQAVLNAAGGQAPTVAPAPAAVTASPPRPGVRPVDPRAPAAAQAMRPGTMPQAADPRRQAEAEQRAAAIRQAAQNRQQAQRQAGRVQVVRQQQMQARAAQQQSLAAQRPQQAIPRQPMIQRPPPQAPRPRVQALRPPPPAMPRPQAPPPRQPAPQAHACPPGRPCR